MEFMRFFAVAVVGLTLDLAISWSAAHFLGIALWLAATVGFVTSAAMNYVLLELWTFRSHAKHGLSFARALKYFLSQGITLMARVTIVALLPLVVEGLEILEILIIGSACSFCVNFLISKYIVFSAPSRMKGPLR